MRRINKIARESHTHLNERDPRLASILPANGTLSRSLRPDGNESLDLWSMNNKSSVLNEYTMPMLSKGKVVCIGLSGQEVGR
jgi:hypothetical protein